MTIIKGRNHYLIYHDHGKYIIWVNGKVEIARCASEKEAKEIIAKRPIK